MTFLAKGNIFCKNLTAFVGGNVTESVAYSAGVSGPEHSEGVH